MKTILNAVDELIDTVSDDNTHCNCVQLKIDKLLSHIKGLYRLKPLRQFPQSDGSIIVTSPTHEYVIRDNIITYINLHTNETGIKYCKDYDDCLDWINHTHVPSKLSEYFDVV